MTPPFPFCCAPGCGVERTLRTCRYPCRSCCRCRSRSRSCRRAEPKVHIHRCRAGCDSCEPGPITQPISGGACAPSCETPLSSHWGCPLREWSPEEPVRGSMRRKTFSTAVSCMTISNSEPPPVEPAAGKLVTSPVRSAARTTLPHPCGRASSVRIGWCRQYPYPPGTSSKLPDRPSACGSSRR